MAEKKDKTSRHLRSARQWLTRAEESFDKDRDIRGELDLFLAKAELEHAKQTANSRSGKRYPLFRHGLALAFACLLAAGGWGVFHWASMVPPPDLEQPEVKPLPAAPYSSQATKPPENIPLSPPAVPLNNSHIQRTEDSSTPLPVIRREPADTPTPAPASVSEQKVPVTNEEMRSIIRAAGKSLRGE